MSVEEAIETHCYIRFKSEVWFSPWKRQRHGDIRPPKSEHCIMTIHTIEIDHGKEKNIHLLLKLDPMKKFLKIVLGTQRYLHSHYQKEGKRLYELQFHLIVYRILNNDTIGCPRDCLL